MMQAVVYRENGLFTLEQRPVPEMQEAGDAIVRVTLSSICSSDLHIKHGSVPRAKPGVIVGHEMVGVVEQVGGDGARLPSRVTAWRSMWRPFAGSAIFAGAVLSIIVHMCTGAGRLVAG